MTNNNISERTSKKKKGALYDKETEHVASQNSAEKRMQKIDEEE